MEHDLRFGLVLGWLVLKKKIWVDHEQLLGAVFFNCELLYHTTPHHGTYLL